MSPATPPVAATATPLLVVTLLLVACEQLPEIQYETEHLRIATNFNEPLCQGDLDHLELVVSTLEAQLDTKLGRPVDLYLWDDVSDSSASPGWCRNDTGLGCYKNGVVYSGQLAVDHELVHAVVATIGAPATFWGEGAAEALQSHRTIFNWSAPTANLNLDSPQLSYLTAGHFSRWLLETHGLASYRALLRAPGSAQKAFESTYGMTIEDAEAQYFDQAPHSYGALISCDHAELPQTGDLRWSESIDIDCDNADVHGGPLGMGAYRVLTILERGHYAFSTSAATGVIARCPDEDYELPPTINDPAFGDLPPLTGGFARVFAGDGEMTVLDLAPGRYKVAAGFLDHEARTAQLDVSAATGPIPQTPESAG